MPPVDPVRPLARAPAAILVRPQLAGNIGMAARAMLNFGLTDLRLVAPRDGWPQRDAWAASAGADVVLEAARVFDTVEAAVADLHRVLATTARERGQEKAVLGADGAAASLLELGSANLPTGVLFGPERVGLGNDEVALADAVVSFPVNPGHTSLNLAQAVLIVGYEWWKLASGGEPPHRAPAGVPATRGHLVGFFDQVEAELDAAGFFNPPEKRPVMVRNFRNIFHRLSLTRQDVQTLRGAVQALVRGRRGTRPFPAAPSQDRT